jgi:hypothetical protein
VNAETWLVLCAFAALGMWVIAGLIDAAGDRRPAARVVQPSHPITPLLPPARPGGPWYPEFALARGRRVRAARARTRGVLLGRTPPASEDAVTTARRTGTGA